MGTNIGEYISKGNSRKQNSTWFKLRYGNEKIFTEFVYRVKNSNRNVEAPSESQSREDVTASRLKGKRGRNDAIGSESWSHENSSPNQGLWLKRLSSIRTAALNIEGTGGKITL